MNRKHATRITRVAHPHIKLLLESLVVFTLSSIRKLRTLPVPLREVRLLVPTMLVAPAVGGFWLMDGKALHFAYKRRDAASPFRPVTDADGHVRR